MLSYSRLNEKNGRDAFTPGQLYLAGAGAGLGNSVASGWGLRKSNFGYGTEHEPNAGPVEHIRIRLQTQSSTNPAFKGPLDALKKIYATDGIRGVYHGQVATILRYMIFFLATKKKTFSDLVPDREFHGYGCYFLYYEYQVQRACLTRKIERCVRVFYPLFVLHKST
jgi:solute carrier family 25 carnitine/acylcarnitine transporter 20/29